MSRASTLSGFTTAIGQPTNLNVGVLTCQALSSSDVTFSDDLSLKNLIASDGVTTPGIVVSGISTFGTTGSDSVFINGGTDTHATSTLRFRNNAGNVNYGFIQNRSDNITLGTNSTDPIFFETNNTRRVTITSAGLVGIGTTDPDVFSASADDLVIRTIGDTGITIRSGASNSGNIFFASADGATSNNGIIKYLHNTKELRFQNYGSGSEFFTFYTQNNERFRIKANGNIGIGTDNPNSLLDVHQDAAGDVQLARVYNSNSDGGTQFKIQRTGNIRAASIILGTDTANTWYTGILRRGGGSTSNYSISGAEDMSSTTPTFSIDSSNHVYINAYNHAAHSNMDDLQVGDGVGNRGITIASGASNFGTIAFGDSTDDSGAGTYAGFLEYGHTDNALTFGTDATARLVINNAGVIQHNGNTVANSTSKVHRYTTTCYDNSEEPVLLYQSVNTNTSNTLTIGGGDSAYNSYTQINFRTGSSVNTTSGTDQMIIDSAGDLYLGGDTDANADFVFEKGARASFYRNLYFGGESSATANTQINAIGTATFSGAVKIGGTAAANEMDEYEEGSWTPVFYFGGAASGATFAMQEGHYTKIGRQVIAQFRIELSNKGTSTGAMTISTPFTVLDTFSSTGIDGNTFAGYTSGMSSANVGSADMSGYCQGGTSLSYFTARLASGNASTLNQTDVDNNFSISGTMMFYAA
jgi:hypothetical protein